eukprot:TRINITY_DN948_c0_g1_i1.p1 TRINITY_DN948_c0_g1~~TRINITY_DN948_c0_g1_i1.p1  ORF type:complete len:200 (-),score=33.23 TRINITY_DN948_c0_g1_i1:147-746(-)
MFSNYDELAIQFGFVTLFIIATPITPLLALFNNFLETFLDSRKMTKLFRRPEPRGVYDIGTWRAILEILSVFTVVTNAAIIVFVSTELKDFSGDTGHNFGNGYTPWTLAWVFVVIEHTVFIFKFAIRYFLFDESAEVRSHIARQEYIVDALINNVKDKADAGPSLHQWDDESKHNEQDFEDELRSIPVGFKSDPHVINE